MLTGVGRRGLALMLGLCMALGAVGLLGQADASGAEAAPSYQDRDLPTRLRVRHLLRQMTLQEKVGQMTQISVQALMESPGYPYGSGPLDPDLLELVLADNQVGSLLSGGGGAPVPNTPAAWAEMTNTLQRYTIEHSRLGIPMIYGVDAVHGHNNVLGAQQYPHNLGLGAAGDRELVARLGAATAAEVRATGIHWNFAPVLDVGRDPRWGRYYETWGESPLVTTELGVASIRAQQGADLAETTTVAATAKHFLGYSQPLTGDDRTPADFSMRTLRDVALPPYAAAVESGVATAMANSGSLNGIPVHASRELLTDVLRRELGFDGVLISDWEDILKLVSVYGVAADYASAIELALDAGVDMSMVPLDAPSFTSTLIGLVESGRVSEARIDRSVARILTLKFELGLFDDPYVDPAYAQALIAGADPEVNRAAARATLTLLTNDGTLPLDPGASVLVTGPSADSIRNQLGGWSIGWQGVPEGDPSQVPEGTTVAEGIAAAVDDPSQVTYLPAPTPDEAAAAAAGADVAVVVVGEGPYAEFLGDSDTITLPDEQIALVDALEAAGTPTVVVTIAGRPLVMESQIAGSAATLMAYLPGSEGGGAIADVLFGAADPGGRLPFDWPRLVGQLPLTHDQPVSAKSDPLFAFGHGLDYTTFAYDGLTATPEVGDGGVVEVSVEVTNTGERAGDEVVDAFVTEQPPSLVLQPQRWHIGFARVDLEPGETETVTMSVPVELLARTQGDVSGDGPREVVPGEYTLSVEGVTASFTVSG